MSKKMQSNDKFINKEESKYGTFSEKEFQCGIFSWRPKWLQVFAKPMYFAFVNLFFAVFQGAMKTGLNSSMTTIERKFGMSGKMISVVMVMDNITGTIASLIIGYYATKISRPRILVFGVWMSVAACFFFILPHILYSHIEVTGNISSMSVKRKGSNLFTQFCRLNQTESNIQNSAFREQPPQELSVAYPVLVCLSIGNLLNGLGGTSFYIAGTTYTDDSVKKKNTAMYFGIMMAIRMFGPLLGIFVHSYFLTVYEHPGKPAPAGITTLDPRWIGAWWLPFVFWGCLMTIAALPMMFFPKHMRKQAARAQGNKISKLRKNKTSLWQSLKNDVQDFCVVVRRLSKNGVYMWDIIGLIFIINGLGGYIMNFPKYMESQYRVSAAKASALTGSTKVLALVLAIISGGIWVRTFKPSARTICLYTIISDVFNISVLISAIFLVCDNWALTGSNINEHGIFSMRNVCNEGCLCNTKFEPFCDLSSNNSYASPCFAGCFGSNLTNMHCNCLQSPPTSPRIWDENAEFASGFCRNDCSNLTIFLIIATVAKFVSAFPRVGTALIALRCIDPADKAISVGFANFMLNIFAFIPYPLIYGTIFDSTCLIWGERNGEKSNCWYYDNDLLRRRYLLTTIGLYLVGLLCIVVMWYYAKDVKNMYEEEEEEDIQKDKNSIMSCEAGDWTDSETTAIKLKTINIEEINANVAEK